MDIHAILTALRNALASRAPPRERCPVCNGDDFNTPCAYPGEDRPGCMRDERRRLDEI